MATLCAKHFQQASFFCRGDRDVASGYAVLRNASSSHKKDNRFVHADSVSKSRLVDLADVNDDGRR